MPGPRPQKRVQGLTQICVEEGADIASQEQGPLKVGSRQLAVEKFEALDGPRLGWQLPGGLHGGSIEHRGGEAQRGGGCGENGTSGWQPVCPKPGALQGRRGCDSLLPMVEAWMDAESWLAPSAE